MVWGKYKPDYVDFFKRGTQYAIGAYIFVSTPILAFTNTYAEESCKIPAHKIIETLKPGDILETTLDGMVVDSHSSSYNSFREKSDLTISFSKQGIPLNIVIGDKKIDFSEDVSCVGESGAYSGSNSKDYERARALIINANRNYAFTCIGGIFDAFGKLLENLAPSKVAEINKQVSTLR